jgi:hypothetical protein
MKIGKCAVIKSDYSEYIQALKSILGDLWIEHNLERCSPFHDCDICLPLIKNVWYNLSVGPKKGNS